MTQEEKGDNAHVVAPPPLLYALGLVIGLLLNRYVPLRVLPPPWTTRFGILFCACGVVGLLALIAFARAHTDPRPWIPAAALVTSGPYRFTRNPMYLGLTLIYLGVSFWVNMLWPVLFLPIVLAVMTWGVIVREERYLERRFGESYAAYRKSVRRWL